MLDQEPADAQKGDTEDGATEAAAPSRLLGKVIVCNSASGTDGYCIASRCSITARLIAKSQPVLTMPAQTSSTRRKAQRFAEGEECSELAWKHPRDAMCMCGADRLILARLSRDARRRHAAFSRGAGCCLRDGGGQ